MKVLYDSLGTYEKGGGGIAKKDDSCKEPCTINKNPPRKYGRHLYASFVAFALVIVCGSLALMKPLTRSLRNDAAATTTSALVADNMNVVDNFGEDDNAFGTKLLGTDVVEVEGVTRTKLVGADLSGSGTFDDSSFFAGKELGPITSIEVGINSKLNVLMHLAIGYANGVILSHPEVTNREFFNTHLIQLDKNENIVKVFGYSGSCIGSIAFQNQYGKQYGPYGCYGNAKVCGSQYSFDYGGEALVYIYGRGGLYLNQEYYGNLMQQIGFAFGKPLPAPELSTYRSEDYGMHIGTFFDDSQGNIPSGKIYQINMRVGDCSNYFQACYKNSGCKSHGGTGNPQGGISDYTFNLADDEYLVEMRAVYFPNEIQPCGIGQIQFYTSKNRVSQLSRGISGTPFTLKKDGYVINHFFGHANGDYPSATVQSLGAVYSKA